MVSILVVLCTTSFGQTPNEWLNAHNKYRRTLVGHDGKPTSSPDLVWSARLARGAQVWANKLAASGRLQHSPNSDFGENLGAGYGGTTAVDAWAGREKALFNPLTGSCHPTSAVCGHYTQVISQLSKEVGCANASSADGMVFTVCNYFPHGNLQENGRYAELYPNQRPPDATRRRRNP
jgi:pathogenesis-related protein 1